MISPTASSPLPSLSITSVRRSNAVRYFRLIRFSKSGLLLCFISPVDAAEEPIVPLIFLKAPV